MLKDINFLKERLALFKKKRHKLFLLRTWAFIVIAVYSLLILAAFSWRILVNKENEILRKKINKEENLIKGLEGIETKQLYLNSKIKSLAAILASKKKHQEIVESIFTILPPGVSVDNFHISKQGTISFSARCLDFKTFQRFLTNLQSKNDSSHPQIKEVHISEINYGFNQEYSLAVSLAFFLTKQE